MAAAEHLPDDALVLRGGKLNLEDLMNNILKTGIELGRPGLSVHAADVGRPEALLGLVGTRVPNLWVAFTTVERLRRHGFHFEQTAEPPHHTVWLPERRDTEYW